MRRQAAETLPTTRCCLIVWASTTKQTKRVEPSVVDPEATAAHRSAAPPGLITQVFCRCYGNFQHNTTVSVHHKHTLSRIPYKHKTMERTNHENEHF